MLTVLTTRPVLHACMLTALCLLTNACTDLTSSGDGGRPTLRPLKLRLCCGQGASVPHRATGISARWHVRRVTQGGERCRLLSDADPSPPASHDLKRPQTTQADPMRPCMQSCNSLKR